MIIQFRLKLDRFYCIGGYELTEKDFFDWLDKLMHKNELLLV